jgi:hypothetical protein
MLEVLAGLFAVLLLLHNGLLPSLQCSTQDPAERQYMLV